VTSSTSFLLALHGFSDVCDADTSEIAAGSRPCVRPLCEDRVEVLLCSDMDEVRDAALSLTPSEI
jgi:hypothetical protein